MHLSKQEKNFLIAEISSELRAKRDGRGVNLIARCPFCGKEGKFGIYVGEETARKKPFVSHCFSCGYSGRTLDRLLETIGRKDLKPAPLANPEQKLNTTLLTSKREEIEIDDTLSIISLPCYYKRSFSNDYLKKRGFTPDDYQYFQAGVTGEENPFFKDCVIFPIKDRGDTVGYVARHTLSKKEIEIYNRSVKVGEGQKILRFRNSRENNFVKLLYNYDAVKKDETGTVILVEGIFDTVALTRKLDLYDSREMAVVATFGKKISHVQIYKLQSKGVKTVIIAYDGDAVETIKKIASDLKPYFGIKIACIEDPSKDWDDLSETEVRQIFSEKLINPLDYRINKVQQ